MRCRPFSPVWSRVCFRREVPMHGTHRSIRIALFGLLSLQAASAQSRPLSHLEAFRFANRTTFGPKRSEVAQIQRDGYEAWMEAQFRAAPSRYPEFLNQRAMEWSQYQFLQMAAQNDDQLRQRVAFALHKIFVVSAATVTDPPAMTSYLNLLSALAFDNIYVVLKQITLHPAMGEFLDMVNNDAARPGSIAQPNENYARELLQLFSIGLVALNRDGTARLDDEGSPIPAYTEDDVKNFTRALTGWTYAQGPGTNADSSGHNRRFYGGFMTPIEENHDVGAKKLLNGVELPAGRTAQQDLDSVIENLYSHPNLAPFLSKQLIKHLVTSNPSPEYVARVSAVFEDNGAGVKGDLKAVLRAILLDREALDPLPETSGHLKEPVLAAVSLVRQIGTPTGLLAVVSTEITQMGQRVLLPPSVFSYFSPDYRLPGSDLTGPEFEIYNSQTALARANFTGRALFGGFPGILDLDTKRYVDVAGDMAALLRLVDMDLLGGWMHEAPEGGAMRDAIAKAVDAQEGAANRAATALYLVGTSAQFQVVR